MKRVISMNKITIGFLFSLFSTQAAFGMAMTKALLINGHLGETHRTHGVTWLDEAQGDSSSHSSDNHMLNGHQTNGAMTNGAATHESMETCELPDHELLSLEVSRHCRPLNFNFNVPFNPNVLFLNNLSIPLTDEDVAFERLETLLTIFDEHLMYIKQYKRQDPAYMFDACLLGHSHMLQLHSLLSDIECNPILRNLLIKDLLRFRGIIERILDLYKNFNERRVTAWIPGFAANPSMVHNLFLGIDSGSESLIQGTVNHCVYGPGISSKCFIKVGETFAEMRKETITMLQNRVHPQLYISYLKEEVKRQLPPTTKQ